MTRPSQQYWFLFIVFAALLSFYDPQKFVVLELFGRFYNGFFPRIHSLGLIVLWMISLYAAWLVLIYEHPYRRLVGVWIIGTLIVNAAFYEITKNSFNEYYYGISLAEFHHAYGMVKNHGWHLFMTVVDDASIVAMAIGGMRFLFRRWNFKLDFTRRHLAFVSAVVVCGFIQVFKYKTNFSATPSFVSVPASIAYHHKYALYDGPRHPVTTAPTNTPDADILMVVVDESVRADLMSANGYQYETTPFLAKNIQSVNFGIAASSANCSKYSNTILRNALPRRKIPDKKQLSLQEPSLFQYAQKAGYHTVYITNHMQPGQTFDNGMNAADMPFIDSFVSATEKPTCDYAGDCVLIERLAPLIKAHKKIFIYMNKNGVHYPYENAYPHPQALSIDKSIPLIMHNYLCGMRWSADTFMQHLMHQLEQSSRDYLVFYTSDHGEDIENVGSRNGHGSFVGGNWKQAAVPLIVLSNQKDILAFYRKVQTQAANKASHFEIAPSLLVHMGYNRKWVHKHFDAPFHSWVKADQRFYSGNIYQMGHWNDFQPDRSSQSRSQQ